MTRNSNDDKSPVSRRGLLQSALGAAGAFAAGGLVSDVSYAAAERTAKMGTRILVQGDSITDAGRSRKHDGPNVSWGFGRGYPFLVASYLVGERPQDEILCWNRGISGHKVPDLDKRWQKDTIDLKPDILSILIGVNDIWHKLNGRYDGTVETYEKGFEALLERTKKALPETRLVICEPFALKCGAVNDNWFPEMDERRAAAKRVAEKAGTTWVPFQSMFDEACKSAEPKYWAHDGVHPTMAGHYIMAKKWLSVVKP